MLNESEQKLLLKLFEFADKNRVAFFPIQDIIKKVKTMASSGNKCICKPDERICPCKESINELNEKGQCFCMLFCTYKHGNEYLNKYGYIYKERVTTDTERKQIVKEKERTKIMMQSQ